MTSEALELVVGGKTSKEIPKDTDIVRSLIKSMSKSNHKFISRL